MPLEGLVLVLVAAVAHALWNRRLHVAGDRLATIAVANVVVGLALAPAIVLWPPWRVWPLILLSGLTEAIYSLCLTAAYRRGALAVAYPLGRGAAPFIVTLGGWFVLAERPNAAGLVGTLLLAGGMTVIATVGWRAGQGGAVGFAALTGLAIATYSLIDARAVRAVPVIGYFGAVSLLAGLLLTGVVRDRGRLRGAIGPGLRVAAGAGTAYLLVLLAFQRADAGRVAALRESSILIAIWLAGGQPGRRVWLGAALIVGGIALAAAF